MTVDGGNAVNSQRCINATKRALCLRQSLPRVLLLVVFVLLALLVALSNTSFVFERHKRQRQQQQQQSNKTENFCDKLNAQLLLANNNNDDDDDNYTDARQISCACSALLTGDTFVTFPLASNDDDNNVNLAFQVDELACDLLGFGALTSLTRTLTLSLESAQVSINSLRLSVLVSDVSNSINSNEQAIRALNNVFKRNLINVDRLAVELSVAASLYNNASAFNNVEKSEKCFASDFWLTSVAQLFNIIPVNASSVLSVSLKLNNNFINTNNSDYAKKSCVNVTVDFMQLLSSAKLHLFVELAELEISSNALLLNFNKNNQQQFNNLTNKLKSLKVRNTSIINNHKSDYNNSMLVLFENVVNLEYLSIENCKLTTFLLSNTNNNDDLDEKTTLNNVLTTLSLSKNNLKRISSDLFGINKRNTVNTSALISSILETKFLRLNSLDLSFNKLSSLTPIEAQLLTIALPALTQLHLQGNLLTLISIDSLLWRFVGKNKFQVLSIKQLLNGNNNNNYSTNQFKVINEQQQQQQQAPQPTNLELLNLSDNKIESIIQLSNSTTTTATASNLRILDLSNNSFSNNKPLIEIIDDLLLNVLIFDEHFLNAANYAKIRRLTKATTTINNIEDKIDISKQQSICDILAPFNVGAELSITNNALIELSAQFPFSSINCATITSLNLRFNYISKINVNSFINFKQLETLDLSNNLISSLSLIMQNNQTFSSSVFGENCNTIKLLNLSNNLIEIINSNTFSHLINIEHLSLSNNKIIEISTLTFARNELLSTLDISSNELQKLSSNALSTLTKLTTFEQSTTNALILMHAANNSLIENLDILNLFTRRNSLATSTSSKPTTLASNNNGELAITTTRINQRRKQQQQQQHRNNQHKKRLTRDDKLATAAAAANEQQHSLLKRTNNIIFADNHDEESINNLNADINKFNVAQSTLDFSFNSLNSIQIQWLVKNESQEKFVLINACQSLATTVQLLDLSYNKISKLLTLQSTFINLNYQQQITSISLFDCLTNLQKFNLRSNKLNSLNEFEFNKLTQLSYIDLSQNELSVIQPRSIFVLQPQQQVILNNFYLNLSSNNIQDLYFNELFMNNNTSDNRMLMLYNCDLTLDLSYNSRLKLDLNSAIKFFTSTLNIDDDKHVASSTPTWRVFLKHVDTISDNNNGNNINKAMSTIYNNTNNISSESDNLIVIDKLELNFNNHESNNLFLEILYLAKIKINELSINEGITINISIIDKLGIKKLVLNKQQKLDFIFTTNNNNSNQYYNNNNSIKKHETIFETNDLNSTLETTNFTSLIDLSIVKSKLTVELLNKQRNVFASSFKNLRKLSLAFNELINFEFGSNDLPSLKSLNLSYNLIKSLNKFPYHSKLEELDLSYNKIEELTLTSLIKSFPNLRKLIIVGNKNLIGNKFTAINVNKFKYWYWYETKQRNIDKTLIGETKLKAANKYKFIQVLNEEIKSNVEQTTESDTKSILSMISQKPGSSINNPDESLIRFELTSVVSNINTTLSSTRQATALKVCSLNSTIQLLSIKIEQVSTNELLKNFDTINDDYIKVDDDDDDDDDFNDVNTRTSFVLKPQIGQAELEIKFCALDFRGASKACVYFNNNNDSIQQSTTDWRQQQFSNPLNSMFYPDFSNSRKPLIECIYLLIPLTSKSCVTKLSDESINRQQLEESSSGDTNHAGLALQSEVTTYNVSTDQEEFSNSLDNAILVPISARQPTINESITIINNNIASNNDDIIVSSLETIKLRWLQVRELFVRASRQAPASLLAALANSNKFAFNALIVFASICIVTMLITSFVLLTFHRRRRRRHQSKHLQRQQQQQQKRQRFKRNRKVANSQCDGKNLQFASTSASSSASSSSASSTTSFASCNEQTLSTSNASQSTQRAQHLHANSQQMSSEEVSELSVSSLISASANSSATLKAAQHHQVCLGSCSPASCETGETLPALDSASSNCSQQVAFTENSNCNELQHQQVATVMRLIKSNSTNQFNVQAPQRCLVGQQPTFAQTLSRRQQRPSLPQSKSTTTFSSTSFNANNVDGVSNSMTLARRNNYLPYQQQPSLMSASILGSNNSQISGLSSTTATTTTALDTESKQYESICGYHQSLIGNLYATPAFIRNIVSKPTTTQTIAEEPKFNDIYNRMPIEEYCEDEDDETARCLPPPPSSRMMEELERQQQQQQLLLLNEQHKYKSLRFNDSVDNSN